jgi:hypothetical protein
MFFGLVGLWKMVVSSQIRSWKCLRLLIYMILSFISGALVFLSASTRVDLTYIWYHSGYVRITVTHRDFTETIKCNFCKIIASHRNSSILPWYQTHTYIRSSPYSIVFFYIRWLEYSLDFSICFSLR